MENIKEEADRKMSKMVSMLQLGIFLTMSICLASSSETKKDTLYLFYASKYFSPDDGLNITVILFEKKETATKVTVTLKDDGKDLKMIAHEIPAGERIAFLKMNTKDLERKKYTLHLNLGAILTVHCDFKVATFIQTDKGIYKPGETVKFRVLNVFRNYTATNVPGKASIKDANGNLLYKLDLTSKNGVSSSEFQISSRPVLGTWTIETEMDQSAKKTSFKVEKYVLPKVEVTTTVPKYIYKLEKENLNGVILTVGVKARYTQGRNVSGKATLSIYGNCVRKTSISQKIKGDTTFKIDLGKVGASKSCYYLMINVSVVNNLDEKAYHAVPVSTAVRSFPIDIVRDYKQNTYKENEMSNFKVTVKRLDDQPLTDEDRKNPLKISVKSENFIYDTTSKIPENGIVDFSFITPNQSSLPVKVIYNGEYGSEKYSNEQNLYLSSFSSFFRFFMTRMDGETSKPEFLLSFPDPVTNFFYTVVTRSTVFISKEVEQKPARSATISFESLGMFPKAHIVAGYKSELGNLEITSATVNVERITSATIVAKFKEPSVKPGQEAELTIKSISGVTAFVAAVDKSVLLLAEQPNPDYDTILFGSDERIGRCFDNCEEVFELENIGISSHTNLNISNPIIFKEAFSPTSKSTDNGPSPRTNFQESWLWDTIDLGSTGTASLVKTAPDAITTWVTTFFGMHPTEGFIPSNGNVELITYKDFYISLGIPYSVIRGETFELSVYVFNYIAKAETVTVQLMNPDKTVKEEKTTNMAADETEVAVKFMIEPKDIGNIPVLVQASIPGYKDAVQRNLNVIVEGFQFEKSEPLSVNVSSKESFTKLVEIEYPPNVLKGSKIVSVSAIGDIMGPVLSGLERLIRFPTGCGEQTMLSLYPNVLVYVYLETRGKLSLSTKQKLERNTVGGYQNELNYQHKEGSFSAFGDRDISGSTWLTSYVVTCFCKAKYHMKDVSIDSKVIEKAVSWLLKQQQKDGVFREVGRVIHTDMQGGTSSGVTLTAFVAISLLHAKELNVVNVEDSLKKTASYLRSWVDNSKVKDAYSLSVVLTVFALLKDDEYFNKVNKQLLSLATKKDKKLYWPSSTSKSGDSKSVELAAYVLLAYSYKHKTEEGVPIKNYLVIQRNSHGGFHSTQDTVMALAALAQYAMLFSQNNDSAVDVKIETDEGTKYSFETITQENSIILYKKDLPSTTKNVKVAVTGNGYVLVQVNWLYNLIPEDNNDVIVIEMKQKSSSSQVAKYNACLKYTGKEDTGMVLMSVNTLSGYTANPVDPSSNSLIMKSEVVEDKLVVYLDSLPNDKEVCIPMAMHYNTFVKDMKPQVAEVYIYYQPNQSAKTLFLLSSKAAVSGNMLQSACLVIVLLSTSLFQLLI